MVEVPPRLTVRCLGGFCIDVGSRPVDLGCVKPRARKLLRLLALHVGRPVHREVLIEALWPASEPDTGARNLHVAVSSLRQFLQGGPCADLLRIAREGEDYRLVAAATASIDVAEFTAELVRSRHCRAAGRPGEAISALGRALWLYGGDLFPEDGPEEDQGSALPQDTQESGGRGRPHVERFRFQRRAVLLHHRINL